MTAEEILKKVQTVLSPNPKVEETEAKLSEVITDSGVTIYFDNELIEGTSVYTIVDGANIPLEVGEYMLPDGTSIIVNEVGVVGQILVAQAPEKENVVVEETPTTLSKEDVSTLIAEALKPLTDQLQELSKVKEENTELKTQLSEHPASDGITASPEGKKVETLGVSLNAKNSTIGINRVYEMLYGN